MAVDVRPAGPGDVAGIADVHVRSWQHGYAGLLPQQVLDGLRAGDRIPRWTATVAGQDPPGRATLVAVDGGAVVGFSDLRPADDGVGIGTGEIASFYVDPDVWARGVGGALMAASLAAFAGAGFTSALLWVLAGNERATRFYRAAGFTPDGGVRDDVVGDLAIQDLRYRRAIG